MATLHEKVASTPTDDQVLSTPNLVNEQGSPVKWGKAFDQLTEEERKHAWLTDGSAKYVGGKRFWKAVGYNPSANKFQVITGEGKSSQYAELYAVYMVIKQEELGQCHIFTDSWSVANGLTTWLPTWAKNNRKIYSKEVWGKELWQDIWAFVQQTQVTVFHVDAHCGADTLERWYNSITDSQAKISHVDVEDPHQDHQMGLVKWTHQKCGHLGEKATYRWAQDRGVPIHLDLIKTIIAHCPVCQHTQQRPIPHTVRGQFC